MPSLRRPSQNQCYIAPQAKTALRPSAVLLACAAALLSQLPTGNALAQPQTTTATAREITVALPAQPLAQTIDALARLAGVGIGLDTSLATGRNAPAIQGAMTLGQALERALAGSGLVVSSSGSGVSIRRAEGDASGNRSLAPVTVQASQDSPVGPDLGYRAKRSRGATKTDTPLIETPQAITVITREQIRDRAAATVSESLRNVAGVIANDQAGRRDRDDFIIRGFTQSTFILRDGLRNYSFQFVGNEPAGLERIEVLKGPSSVLYGQLAPGGTVNLVSKQPNGEALREVELGYGRFEAARLAVDLGDRFAPESDWSWRLNALTSRGEDAIDFVDRKRNFIAPSLKWQPSANTSLTLLGLYQDSRSNRPAGLPAAGTVLPNVNGPIPFERNITEPAFEGVGTVFKQAQLGYMFEHGLSEGLKFRQNLRYSNVKIDANNVFGGSLQPNQRLFSRSISIFDQEVSTLALDNQIQWDVAAGGAKHTLTGGLDYFQYDQALIGFGGTVGPIDLFSPVYGTTVTRGAVNFASNEKGNQYGVYLQDQIKFDDRWIGLAGVRHDRVDIDSRNGLSGSQTITDPSKTTGRLGFLYLSPTGLAPYISYATSFVPVSGSTVRGSRFVPETGAQFELGVKYEPPGSSVLVTAALYDLKRQNITTTDPSNPAFSIQVGEQRHRGFELEAQGRLVRGLQLSGSYSFIDAEISRSNSGNQGKRPTSVPRQTASLWLKYDMQGDAWRGWAFGGGVRYNGSSAGDTLNTFNVPSFAILDAAVYYQADQWRFALHAKNLADKRYITACFSANGCFPGEYRTVTATASFSF